MIREPENLPVAMGIEPDFVRGTRIFPQKRIKWNWVQSLNYRLCGIKGFFIFGQYKTGRPS
jgi:hypothetical protein